MQPPLLWGAMVLFNCVFHEGGLHPLMIDAYLPRYKSGYPAKMGFRAGLRIRCCGYRSVVLLEDVDSAVAHTQFRGLAAAMKHAGPWNPPPITAPS